MPTTNDPISDMLTRIRNAISVRHQSVTIPKSKSLVAVAALLKKEGYIKDYDVVEKKPQGVLTIQLLYRAGRESAIRGLKRMSKPGLRVYVGRGEIPRIYGGLGTAMVSTSKGLMTGSEAWRTGIGGELICYVW